MSIRNKALIITGIILLVLSLIIFLIGGWIAGWDFAAFFTSQTFVWICVLVGVYLLAVVGILIWDKVNKL